jgi:hypothetical protein
LASVVVVTLGIGATITVEDIDFVLSATDVPVTATVRFEETVAGAL